MTRSSTLSTGSRTNAAAILDTKAARKEEMQKQMGWKVEPKRPVICLPSGMTDQLGGALLVELIPGLLSLPVEILIRGKGSSTYGALFTKLASEYGHRIAIIPDTPSSVREMLEASDMALFLADPSDQSELSQCLAAGTIPVAPQTKSLKTYNPNQEEGNSFLFERPSVWHAFAGMVRALETFRFPYDWKTIQKQAIGEEE